MDLDIHQEGALLLNYMDDIYCRTDEHGIILFANQACKNVLGYEPDYLIGKNIIDFIAHYGKKTAPAPICGWLRSRKTIRLNVRILASDLSAIDLDVRIKYFRGEPTETSGFILSGRESKVNRNAVASAQHELFNLSMDILGIMDLDGVILEISKSCQSILGWEPDQILQRHYSDFVHPSEKSIMGKRLKELIEMNCAGSLKNRFLCKNGTYKWLLWDASADQAKRIIFFVVRDATLMVAEIEALNAQILQNENMLKTTIDNLQGVVYHCLDDENWTMQYMSRGCQELTGYAPEEIINNAKTSFASLVIPKYRATLMAQKNLVYRHEYEIITKDGEARWIMDRGKTLFSDSGQAIRQEGILTDISATKELEKKLKASHEQLQSITDNLTEVIWLYDIDSASILFVNPAFERLWGISCAELYQDAYSFMRPIHPQDREAVAKKYAEHLAGSDFDMIYRIVQPTGPMKWIHAKTKKVRDTTGKVIGLVGSAKDITELKKNEEYLESLIFDLQQKDQYLASIMETQNEMICRFLPDTTLTFVNEAYCRYIEKDKGQLIGKKLVELHPPEIHQKITGNLAKINTHTPSVRYQQNFTDKNGKEVWQDWVDKAIFNQKKAITEFQSVGHDITNEKKAEQRIAASLDLLSKTQKIAKIGSYTVDLDQDRCMCSDFLNELLGIEQLEIHPMELWSSLIHPDDRPRVLAAHQSSIKAGTGFSQEYRIIRQNDHTEIWVNDTGTIEPGKNGKPEKLIGTIMDITKRKILIQELNHSNRKLLEAYESTIEGWAYALEMKEEETKEHSRRVTALTMQLAEKMAIAEDELVHIKRGAILHDIGKIAIPDSILLKPSPLDAEEWAIMKKHPEHAYTMLSNIDYLRPALAIPYCHHEKWDGSGYPRALKGKDIPLPARIFAVADVFDALVSERPYKKPWNTKEALQYLSESSGTHFDPEIIEIFRSLSLG